MDLLAAGQLVAVLIGALGGSAGLIMFFTLRQQKRKLLAEAAKTNSEGDKTDAEAAEILARASAGMLGPFQDTISSLKRQLTEANVEIEELNRKLRTANKRVAELEDSVEALTRNVDAANTDPGGLRTS